MKWSSTAAALLVLVVSASVHADVYSDYQRDGEAPAAEGPEFAAPMPSEDASVIKAATPRRAAGEEPAEVPAEAPAVEPSYEYESDDGAMAEYGAYGYGGHNGHGAGYGSCQSCGAGGHNHLQNCCEYMDPKAAHLWDDYCASKHKDHGWLLRMHCRFRSRCCCSVPTPKPLLAGHRCGCKGHFMWASLRKPSCGGCRPICESCEASCGPHKVGGLLSRFVGWMHKGDECCQTDGCANDTVSGEWSEGDVYEYDPEGEISPLPPPPEATPETPAESETVEEKSARRGLFPEAFRLFPIGR